MSPTCTEMWWDTSCLTREINFLWSECGERHFLNAIQPTEDLETRTGSSPKERTLNLIPHILILQHAK